MPETSGRVWLGLAFSVFTTVLFGLELAFNVYAVDLKQTFNFTQTEVELVSVSGVAGMGASLIEPFITSRFGYKAGYLVIWTTTTGSAFLMWVVVVFKDVTRNWRSVVCLIQFLMNAGQNAGSTRLTTTSIQLFPERHTGKIVGLGLAAIAGGKLFYGGIMDVFFEQDLQGFFLAVAFCQAISFGICFFLHRPDNGDCTKAPSTDSSETLPLVSSLGKANKHRVSFGSVKISRYSDENSNLEHILSHSEDKIPLNSENALCHSNRLSSELEKILCCHEVISLDMDKILCQSDETRTGLDNNACHPDERTALYQTETVALPDKMPLTGENTKHHGMENPFTEMIRSSYFHLMFWPSAVIYSILFTYMNNITSVAYSIGVDEPMNAVYILSVAILTGRFTFGLLFDRFKSNLFGFVLLLIGSSSAFGAITLVVLQVGNTTLYIVTLLLGIGIAVGLSIPSSLLAVRFGQQNLAYIIGCLYSFTAIFSFLFQYLVGVLYDQGLSSDGFCYGPVCFVMSSIVLLIPMAISMVIHVINFIINGRE